MTKVVRATLALVAVAVAAVAVVGGGTAASEQAKTVTIGWAYDGVGAMAPFDGPALAAAKTRIAQVNRTNAIKLRLITCNTQNNKPAIAKACASKLLSQGADIIMTTCDVDFAAPVVQSSINAGKLTVAACIGTDQMGPKRFGAKGRLAFSYGNVAQDEGSAMAEYAWKRGWRTASLATDTVIVYFRNVVQAFKARFTAARREDRRGGDVPVARRQPRVVAEHGDAAERRGSRRHRHRRRPQRSAPRCRSSAACGHWATTRRS